MATNLPPNIVGAGQGTIGQQSQAAMDTQRLKMTELKAVTGGAVAVAPLASGFSGPANIQMQKTYTLAVQQAGQSAANSEGDSQARVGGSKSKSKQSSNKRSKRRWSAKYKRSINCRRPRGFSQRQHCKYGRKSTRRKVKRNHH